MWAAQSVAFWEFKVSLSDKDNWNNVVSVKNKHVFLKFHQKVQEVFCLLSCSFNYSTNVSESLKCISSTLSVCMKQLLIFTFKLILYVQMHFFSYTFFVDQILQYICFSGYWTTNNQNHLNYRKCRPIMIKAILLH